MFSVWLYGTASEIVFIEFIGPSYAYLFSSKS